MIGLSGSGKSTWSRAAVGLDWVHIDSDQLLKNALNGMRASGEVASEIGAVPDPGHSGHMFDLRLRGQTLAQELLARTTESRRSFVWDSLGLNDFKIKASSDLRQKGYQIWWMLFHTEGIERNRFNLFLRESIGGHGSFREQPLEIRCGSLNRMLSLQLEELRKIEKELESERPKEVDVVFRVEVPDLSGSSPVKDPCASLAN